jgi:hypothetical protein
VEHRQQIARIVLHVNVGAASGTRLAPHASRPKRKYHLLAGSANRRRSLLVAGMHPTGHTGHRPE